MTDLEDKSDEILGDHKNLTRYYRASLEAASREVNLIKDKNPYTDTFRKTMLSEVTDFCCDVQLNKEHRDKVLKWLDDFY
jgi:hypothetical protein